MPHERCASAGILLLAGLLLTACAPAATLPAPVRPALDSIAVVTPLTPAEARRELARAADSVFSDPKFRTAMWAALIVDPATGDTIYSRNPRKLVMPASNMKIITGAVALHLLGPDYRFRTTFAARCDSTRTRCSKRQRGISHSGCRADGHRGERLTALRG